MISKNVTENIWNINFSQNTNERRSPVRFCRLGARAWMFATVVNSVVRKCWELLKNSLKFFVKWHRLKTYLIMHKVSRKKNSSKGHALYTRNSLSGGVSPFQIKWEIAKKIRCKRWLYMTSLYRWVVFSVNKIQFFTTGTQRLERKTFTIVQLCYFWLSTSKTNHMCQTSDQRDTVLKNNFQKTC